MSIIELAELVLKTKTPKIQILGEKAELWIEADIYPISLEQADLLFRTMFFRGKF